MSNEGKALIALNRQIDRTEKYLSSLRSMRTQCANAIIDLHQPAPRFDAIERFDAENWEPERWDGMS